jgi:hypothetical protein
MKQKEKKLPAATEPTVSELFAKFTDAQRFLFATKLSSLHEVGSEYATMGESKEDFVKRLAEMLLEERYFKNSSLFCVVWAISQKHDPTKKSPPR